MFWIFTGSKSTIETPEKGVKYVHSLRYTFADLKIYHYLRLHIKKSVEGFTFKNLLFFEICARWICEKFVFKHSETIKYVKN